MHATQAVQGKLKIAAAGVFGLLSCSVTGCVLWASTSAVLCGEGLMLLLKHDNWNLLGFTIDAGFRVEIRKHKKDSWYFY